jgi:hypothetical protein
MSDLEGDIARFKCLKVHEIVKAVQQAEATHPLPFALTKRLQSNKAHLIRKLLGEGPHWEDILLSAVHESAINAHSRQQDRRVRAAERRQISRHEARAREREEQSAEHDPSRFLELPSASVIQDRYKAFYEATTNEALCMKVCAVCARSVNVRASGLVTRSLNDIPNLHRLRPNPPHAAQVLTEGLLLERAGCTRDEDGWQINMCQSCYTDLKVSNRSFYPKNHF